MKQKGFIKLLLIILGLVVATGGIYLYIQNSEKNIQQNEDKSESTIEVSQEDNSKLETVENEDSFEGLDDQESEIEKERYEQWKKEEARYKEQEENFYKNIQECVENLTHQDSYYKGEDCSFKRMEVTDTTDIAIITDWYSSGAYNLYQTVYEIEYLNDGRVLTRELVAYYEFNSEIKENTLAGFGGEIWFDEEKKILKQTGYTEFASNPCKEVLLYQRYDKKWIRTSVKNFKGCIGLMDIFEPQNVPDDLDYTPIETYSISEDMLQKIIQSDL